MMEVSAVPVDPNIHPHWAQETKQFARELGRLDYFEILGCEKDAPLSEIKARYHALQRAYHPDTFYQSPDTDLKAAVFMIAKRLAEAYVVLRDDERREKYTRDVTGPQREQKLRYTQESESEQRKEKVEALGKTTQGRQLVQKAQVSAKNGDLAGAIRDLRTALLFESGNEGIRSWVDELQAELQRKK